MSSFFGECLKIATRRSFHKQYYRYFSVIKAETKELLEEAYKLRYQVYCEENNYSLYTDSPDGMEIDAYDERAEHFLLIHNQSGNVAGTVRVIPPSRDTAIFSLPLQEVCDHPALFNEDVATNLSEISRLCMAKIYRQRPEDGGVLPAYFSDDENEGVRPNENLSFLRRRIPYAPLALLQAAISSALDHRSLNVVVAVTPEDCESFRDMGMSYRVLGPKLEYYANMQPIIFNIKHFLDTMKQRNRPCWEVVSDRSRLNIKADEVALSMWHDGVFDENIREEILNKVL